MTTAFRPVHFPHLRPRLLGRVIPLVLVGLAIHVLLPQISSFSSTWDTLRSLRWWLVAVAVALQVGSYAGSGILLQGLVRVGGGRITIRRGMEITLASGGVGLVAAGIIGSSAATYGWIHRTGDDGQGAGLAATLKPVFNNALLVLIAVFATAHLLILGDLTSSEAIGFAVVFVVLVSMVATMVWSATHPTALHRALGAIRCAAARLRHRHAPVDTAAIDDRSRHDVTKLENAWLLMRRGGWKQPLLGAALNTAFDAATLYVLFIAAGGRIGVAALLTGYSVALLLGKAAFLPGGVGVVEATMLAIVVALGGQRPAAVVAVLAYRLVSFWMPAAAGLPLAGYLQRATTTATRQAPPAPASVPFSNPTDVVGDDRRGDPSRSTS